VLIGEVEHLKKKAIQCIRHKDQAFVLIYQSQKFYLLDNLCPHKAADLCDGHLQDEEISCPWHKARFDIKSGIGLTPLAGKGVKSWPLMIKNGQLVAETD
jgi:nitrite reductase/ring-hydroxylating ferredoxin subunit